MTLVSRLRGAAIAAFLDGDPVRHAVAAARRRLTGATPTVHYHHDVACPWSHLAAQAALRLVDTYPIELRFHLVGPPASDVDAAPALRTKHAVRDAALLAEHWDVELPGSREPDPTSLRKAQSVLIRPRPDREQLALAVELGRALWSHDGPGLTALVAAHGSEASGAIAPHLAREYDRMRKAGFYQAASFGYDGDWYLGVERVGYLEDRLAADTGVTPARRALVPRPARPPARLPGVGARPTLEVWWSFRSPYSYLALAGLERLTRTMPVDLVLKPVMPMVARGLPLARQKREYLLRDAHREAERHGIPFGAICDPLGAGVEHAMAIARLAIDYGHGLDFLTSAARGVWAEAKDLADYVDLRAVVERAGLDWADARTALADDGWRTWAADHAAELDGLGLWGVPSFKVGELIVWGQDRLELIADRLRRHLAAVAAEPEAQAASAPITA